MSLLDEDTRTQVEELLEPISEPVSLLTFVDGDEECQFCEDTEALVKELAGLSEKVNAQITILSEDGEKAKELGIDKTPAIAVIGAEDYGVRFFGIPAGHEFASLLQAVLDVSSGAPELESETLKMLDALEEPIHMQVFVTPTCPYCPGAVVLGHRFAIASPQVKADMVEATEFPELSEKYQVRGVPRTVINESVHIEGAAPEQMVREKIQEALKGA